MTASLGGKKTKKEKERPVKCASPPSASRTMKAVGGPETAAPEGDEGLRADLRADHHSLKARAIQKEGKNFSRA